MRRTRANGLLSSALSSTGGEGGQQASRQGFTGTAEEIGAAHHRFLQLVSLDRVGNAADLAEQAESFREEGSLRAEEIALLDFDRLAGFWQSELGRQVLGRSQFVRRELVFTARFSPEELAALTAEPIDPNLKQEFVVVQGVADLAVLSPSEIWLIDFKTDAVANNELNERVDVYAPQLRLYARALSRIYQRPVAACWLYFLASQMAVKIEE